MSSPEAAVPPAEFAANLRRIEDLRPTGICGPPMRDYFNYR